MQQLSHPVIIIIVFYFSYGLIYQVFAFVFSLIMAIPKISPPDTLSTMIIGIPCGYITSNLSYISAGKIVNSSTQYPHFTAGFALLALIFLFNLARLAIFVMRGKLYTIPILERKNLLLLGRMRAYAIIRNNLDNYYKTGVDCDDADAIEIFHESSMRYLLFATAYSIVGIIAFLIL